MGSGGSMVARLKLKEIDGRAPQGVNAAALRLEQAFVRLCGVSKNCHPHQNRAEPRKIAGDIQFFG